MVLRVFKARSEFADTTAQMLLFHKTMLKINTNPIMSLCVFGSRRYFSDLGISHVEPDTCVIGMRSSSPGSVNRSNDKELLFHGIDHRNDYAIRAEI